MTDNGQVVGGVELRISGEFREEAAALLRGRRLLEELQDMMVIPTSLLTFFINMLL